MTRARILADFGGVTSSATELNLLDGQTDLASQAELDAAAYSDVGVRQDITILALREAVTENRVANNLPNSFIDQFQDDSGIGSETDTDRNASEYVVTTSTPSTRQSGDRQSLFTITKDLTISTGGGAIEVSIDGNETANDTYSWYFDGTAAVAGKWIMWDAKVGNAEVYTEAHLKESGTAVCGTWKWQGSNDTSGSWTDLSADFTWNGSNVTWSNNIAYRYIRVLGVSGNRSGGPYQKQVVFVITGAPVATGTLIQNTNTVTGARTKVSGVMLYKNDFGTATLGTDIIVSFTCNGGTNWTDLVLADMTVVTPVFSTGIKMVKLAEKTCTSGSDVRYKVTWANQSAAKVTQLHGIGLNY